jgi:hypothetical protein
MSGTRIFRMLSNLNLALFATLKNFLLVSRQMMEDTLQSIPKLQKLAPAYSQARSSNVHNVLSSINICQNIGRSIDVMSTD